MTKWLLVALLCCLPTLASARDDGQWGGSAAATREWFSHLRQPDHPTASCCGEADAVEADEWRLDGDHFEVIITNGRGILPEGLRLTVPVTKLVQDTHNPTSHAILFVSSAMSIFCFVLGAGI